MKSKNEGNFSMGIRLTEESSYHIFEENKVRIRTNIQKEKYLTVSLSKRIQISDHFAIKENINF